MNYLQLMEAVSSVALTHPPGCRCTTCRAAGGDERALEAVLMAVAQVAIADEHEKGDNPPPPAGDSYLCCTVCGRTSTTSFASSLRHGWEKCCGYTMRLEHTDADIHEAIGEQLPAQLRGAR